MNCCVVSILVALLAIITLSNFVVPIIEFVVKLTMDIDLSFDNAIELLPSYDFIVVGAGTAGCVVANRLTENPNWNVLLIEAGQNENIVMDVPMLVHYLQRSEKINWQYKTEPSRDSCLGMENNQCKWPRGKVMGGSSVLNYMIYTRGHKQDFDHWAELGNDGWSYDDILPLFQKLENSQIPDAVENAAGTNGPVTVSYIEYKSKMSKAFVDGMQELGLPKVNYNGKQQNGVSYMQTTTKNGFRASSNRAYIDPIKNRKNLHIQRLSTVTKILIDQATKTVTGVQFSRDGKLYTAKASKEVVISAGAINSPQLLMLSGIGPADHLKENNIDEIENLPVGHNLMDHVAAGNVVFKVNVSTPKSEVEDAKNWLPFMGDVIKIFHLPGGCETISFFNSNNFTNTDAYPDTEIFQVAGATHDAKDLKIIFGLKPSIYDTLFKPLELKKEKTFSLLAFVLRPKSRGLIRLKNNDPFTHPLLYANYYEDPSDVEITIKGIKKMIELEKTEAFKRINATYHNVPLTECVHFGYETDDYWECYIRHLSYTVYHYSGTCKMGPTGDPTAVVNPRLKVNGINNLRVADASIMPVIISGHPNAAIFMIGEKAAEMIKEDWK